MPITLSSVRDQLERQLFDTANLTWPADVLDEALRAALADLSTMAYGIPLTLQDLDGALLTTFEEHDLACLVAGGAAYSLRFRLTRKFEEAIPSTETPLDLAQWAKDAMDHFQSLLTLVRLRKFHQSLNQPYAGWTWEEGSDFS